MTPTLQRALLLQQQGRHDLAEKELRQHLASDPADPTGHAALAISLVELEKLDEAEQAAREAAGHAPDMALAHYALACVLTRRNREAEAAAAIQEAIRLEPTDADYHGMHAAIEFERRRWREALAAAETGLQFDPEHITCNNLRAMALVKLGRKAEAGATIDATLARDPDNAASHANKGWTLLEQGRRKEAMHHFRESLRLDPTMDWARAGLVEAIKAGNPIYAVMLKYFLWMGKLSDGARWGILLGGYFGSRFLGGLARTNPEWAPWIMPVRVLYVAFALLCWLAQPLFNLTLFLHPVGRHALDDEQRAQAGWVGVTLLLALGSVAAWLLAGHDADYLVPALVFGLLAIPVAAIYSCPRGWPRVTMTVLTLSLLATGLTAVILITFLQPLEKSPLGKFGLGAFSLFLIGSIASQWIANVLATQRPTR